MCFSLYKIYYDTEIHVILKQRKMCFGEKKMTLKKTILGLTVLTLMTVALVSTASACTLPGLSPGYWKHNVKVYCGGPGHYSGDPKETTASMEKYEAIIQSWYPSAGFTLEMANNIFQDNTQKDLWLPLANVFNAAADRFPYSG